MNILVISSYFGPETSVGVLRVNAFVRCWTNFGHTVHVVTMPFSGRLPTGIKNNPSIEIYQVFPALLKKLRSEDEQGYAKGATGIKRKIVELQYWLKRNIFSNYLDPRLLWWPKAAHFINKKLIANTKFDFMLSTVPSYTAHSVAAFVKMANKNLIWVADYRDLWSGNPIFPGIRTVRLIERNHERFILRKAKLIVSINDSLVSELSKIHGERRYCVVPNGFDDFEVEQFKNIVATKFNTKVSIVYTGSILPRYQDPSPLFKAIKELSEENQIQEGDLGVYFYGDHTALNDFSIIYNKGIEKFLIKCGKVPRDQIKKIQKSADFLLFMGYKPIVEGAGSTAGVVSGKLFEYLISGTEVMAVGVTDKMLVAHMITKAKVGSVYGDDVQLIKNRIATAVQNGVKKVTPDMNYLDQFRRIRQAMKLINEVQNIRLSEMIGKDSNGQS